MKKIILTGSKGFIGQKFIQLYSNSYNIIDLDLPHFDITSSLDIDKLNKHKDVYCIVHLAALSNPKESFQFPNKYYEVNLLGTLNLLTYAVKNNIKNFFFMSSLTIHGSSNKILNEDSDIVANHFYGATKAAAEDVCRLFSTKNKLNINILRPNLVIGASKIPPDLINLCVDEVKNKSKFTIFGDGEHIRDFVHVNDVCKVINSLISYKDSLQIFTLGGNPYSINKIFSIFENKFGEIKKKFLPKNSSSFSLFCSNAKLENATGFKLNVSIDQMINEALNELK